MKWLKMTMWVKVENQPEGDEEFDALDKAIEVVEDHLEPFGAHVHYACSMPEKEQDSSGRTFPEVHSPTRLH